MNEILTDSSLKIEREIHVELAIFLKNISLEKTALQNVVKSLRTTRPGIDWSLIDIPENFAGEVVRIVGQSLDEEKSIQIRFSFQKISIIIDAIPDTCLEAKSEFQFALSIAKEIRTAIVSSLLGIEDIGIKRFGLIRQVMKRVDLNKFIKNFIPKENAQDFSVRTTVTNDIDGTIYNTVKTYESAFFKDTSTPILLLSIDKNTHQDIDLDILFNDVSPLISARIEEMGTATELLDAHVKPYEQEK